MTTSPITVTRTYSIGSHRYAYTLNKNGKALSRVFSNEERLYAVIGLGTMSLSLRRDASELRQSEIEDNDTYIVPVTIKTE